MKVINGGKNRLEHMVKSVLIDYVGEYKPTEVVRNKKDYYMAFWINSEGRELWLTIQSMPSIILPSQTAYSMCISEGPPVNYLKTYSIMSISDLSRYIMELLQTFEREVLDFFD